MKLAWSALQIQGGRDYQEDFFAVLTDQGMNLNGARADGVPITLPYGWALLVLADGMGGMVSGDIAARFASRSLAGYVGEHFAGQADRSQLLLDALVHANDSIGQFVHDNSDHDGMGCTVIAVLVDLSIREVHWISVGDSSLFLLREGEFRLLNEHHVAEDGYSLTSAVDGKNMQTVNLPNEVLQLQGVDMLLLATDGVETLSREEIQSRLVEYAQLGSVASFQDSLWHLRKQLGRVMRGVQDAALPSQDNVTLLGAMLYLPNIN